MAMAFQVSGDVLRQIHNSKISLVTDDDLTSMYSKYLTGEIILWCEGKLETHKTNKRKRNDTGTSRQEKEDEADDIFKELAEKYRGKFDIPKLRLWARMIQADLHDDYDAPPDVPAFDRNSTSKKPKKDSMNDALTNAAIAFASLQ